MKKPRVLLSGATGRLGSVIHADLSDVWDILPTARNGGTGIVKCDLLSRRDRETLLEKDFDVVVNTAAVSSPSRCADHPEECWILNTAWPIMLAEYCSANNIPFVHFSTDLVYSGGNPPYTETSPAVPKSFYGWTKLVADKLILRKCPDALILRISVLCGETSSERKTFSQDVLSGKVKKVFVNCFRNHTPVHWLAEILPGLVSEGKSGLAIASGKYSQSRSAYAEDLLHKNGKNAEYLIHEYAPPGIPYKLQLRGKYYTLS